MPPPWLWCIILWKHSMQDQVVTLQAGDSLGSRMGCWAIGLWEGWGSFAVAQLHKFLLTAEARGVQICGCAECVFSLSCSSHFQESCKNRQHSSPCLKFQTSTSALLPPSSSLLHWVGVGWHFLYVWGVAFIFTSTVEKNLCWLCKPCTVYCRDSCNCYRFGLQVDPEVNAARFDFQVLRGWTCLPIVCLCYEGDDVWQKSRVGSCQHFSLIVAVPVAKSSKSKFKCTSATFRKTLGQVIACNLVLS